jgi:transglutaminase-like putative cysteine protease
LRLAIRHTTRYDFGAAVIHGLQRLRLTPKETQGQRIVEWRMDYNGGREELSYDDQNFNHVSLISILPGADHLEVICEGVIETDDHAGVIGRHSGHMPLWAFLGQTNRTRPGPKMRALLSSVEFDKSDPVVGLHALSSAILESVAYETGCTDVFTTAEEAIGAGCGVCQDHAQIFIGMARSLGFPARYISGYLMMDDRIEQEATHAWAEVFVEGLGWVGFDVSNGISPDTRYVRVATGCDYREAAPMTGLTFGAGKHILQVKLAVEQQTVKQ